MKQNWILGDKVWIHGVYSKPRSNPRVEGKIVHMFSLTPQDGTYETAFASQILYVIEIDTPIDPIYEVRNEFMMWDRGEEE